MTTPSLILNHQEIDLSQVPLHQTVLDYVRHHQLTGTKCGCNEGDCGACTVILLDPPLPPRAINACLALMHSLAGREIRTVESFASGNQLHPAQEAMIRCNGSQCGYCTPGIIASMVECCHSPHRHTPAHFADHLAGNLCRCTGYRPIREALALAHRSSPSPVNPSPTQAPPPPLSVDLPDGSIHHPPSLSDALELHASLADATFVAGATELAVLINKRGTRYRHLILLDRIPDLHGVHHDDTHWHLGAATPLTDLEGPLTEEYPVFLPWLRVFASRQIRHRATLGGNLATASPIGDAAPLLLVLDATLTLASLSGFREIPLSSFFTGYRQTCLQPGELIVAIHLPRHLPGRIHFEKVSRREEMDISAVSFAIRLVTDTDHRVTDIRLAYGGVAATPTRASKAEEKFLGRLSSDFTPVLETLDQAFNPLSDTRGSASYRRTLIRRLLTKFLLQRPHPGHPQPSSSFDDTHGIPHTHALGHVTGSALYVDDVARRRHMLQLVPVLSHSAHATLHHLDLSAAKTVPGVVRIFTAADIPGHNNTGSVRHDEPLFAENTIQFHGQIVAAVVATSLEAAHTAARLVKTSITPLPPILGIPQAIAADSFHTTPHTLTRGNPSPILTQAPLRLQGDWSFGGQEHFYLETQAAWAEPDGDGGILVSSSTQHPSEIQTIVAELLDLPRHRIVVESPRMGGGFGGKETQGNPIAAMVALAAFHLQQPVSAQLDRDVDITITGKRHPFHARFDVAYSPSGKILAADIELTSDGGWSLDLSQPVTDRALFHLDNTYYIPHVRFSGRVAKTHTTSHTAFRGFGGPQGILVIEDILSRIALALNLPPEQVRQQNFYHGQGETNTTPFGQEIEENRIARIWEELLEKSYYQSRKQEIESWNRSDCQTLRGIAITPVKFGISFTLTHYNQAGALVLIYADGSAQINHGGTEMGQGLHTKILAVAMQELGLPADRIRLMNTRTDKVPNTSATAASSGSDLNGMAVADACRQLRDRLAPLAAELLGTDADSIRFHHGQASAPSGASIPLAELTRTAYSRRIPLSATGFYATPGLHWNWDHPKGKPFHYFAFGAAVTEVEIDRDTGTLHILRTDILHDVGNSLNPSIDRGQIEGAFVQGSGWLTREELRWKDDGSLLTHSASTYTIPAVSDAPIDFRVHLLSNAAQARTIHGSKAVGEPPFMLAISTREAIRHALSSTHPSLWDAHTTLASPSTGEVILSHLPDNLTTAPPH